MLRIAIGQMEVIAGRPDLNSRKMLDMIAEARSKNAQMVIFPEMAVPGYLIGDIWEQQAFLRDCENLGRKIVKASDGICVLFVNVGVDWNKTGDNGRVRKYNAFFIAKNGRLCGGDNFPYPFRIKMLNSSYRAFDETRHFYSLRRLAEEIGSGLEEMLSPVDLVIDGDEIRLGCILGEDVWSEDHAVKPVSLINWKDQVDLFVNISTSPYTRGKNNKRHRIFSRQVSQTGVPLIYVDNVGIQNNGKTVYTFDGCSTVYNRSGEVIDSCPAFVEELKIVKMEQDGIFRSQPALGELDDGGIDSIYKSLHYGIGKFLQAAGIEKVVIGVSGGIDSAVSACLYNKILEPERLLLVNMPSIYSSKTTKDLSARLAHNLGCLYTIMPIQEVFEYTVRQIGETPIQNSKDGSQFNLSVSSFVQENIQARDRSARVLAGTAAAFGGGFTCNANKSEMTVGYGTLYGDLAGFLAALADLWKHQVYDLAVFLNECIYCREVIPREIIDLVPSAELSFEQDVDQGKGDPLVYPYHDYLFRAFMEQWDRSTPEEILTWYAAGCLEEKIGCRPGLVKKLFPEPDVFIEDLEKWWKLYLGMGVAKRIQTPPVLTVSRRAYGFDHREAQNPVYFTENYLKLKKKINGFV